MEERTLLEGLEEAACKLGYIVKYEPLGSVELPIRSGACQLKGEHRIYIDNRASLASKIEILARTLAGEDLDAIFLMPAIRNRIMREI